MYIQNIKIKMYIKTNVSNIHDLIYVYYLDNVHSKYIYDEVS